MASDSLIIAGQIELLGAPGGVASSNPLCPGAIFRLQPGYDLGEAQPTSDFIGSLSLDGERPFGRRASDRTITLPLQIIASDFTTLAGALELLSQAIDQQTWTLTWTRDPSQAAAGGFGVGLPLVLDCFRAQASQVMYGGADQTLGSPIGQLTITFQALPYGHSDQPVSIAVASPLPGQSAPPAPVVLDTFSSVSGTDFSSDSSHFIVGPHSAKWTHGGSTFAPSYVKTGLSANLTGLTALSVYLGFGAAFPSTFVNPVTVTFTLTDGTHTLSFSVSRTFTPSGNAGTPHFNLVTAAIPQGRTFTYSAVTGYTILVSSVPASPAGLFGFGFNTWLDHVVANPPTLQAASTRGAVYNVLGVAGTARAPIALQAQQPGATKVVTLSTPGPFQWTAPGDLTGGTADVTVVGAGGAGASLVVTGQGGGGSGGEVAREASLALTAGTTYSGFIGAGGTAQTGISTLAITTTGLPSATVSTPYTTTLTATGGTPAYTWAHTTGVVPTGLSLNTSTGVISGTPSGSAVSPSLGFTVTDSLGATATTVLVLRVVVAATFAITTTSLPNGSVGGHYSQTLATNGVGTPPITWSQTVPGLPPGLTLGTTSGIISGIPTATGTYNFTVGAADSSGTVKTDTQALTIVVTAVSNSTLPLFGWNSGLEWTANNGMWETIFSTVQVGGQAVGYRAYRKGNAGPFPTTWNESFNIPSQATFAVLSWKVDINTLLAGTYDKQIAQWAVSCQRQWNKNPGSIYVSIWHEGDSFNPPPTSAQILGLHAHVYPIFHAAAAAVATGSGVAMYGQIFSRDAVTASPGQWVSCPANISGGSVLDFYGVDGYDHNRSAATVFNNAFAAIRSVCPTAVVAITECNCVPQSAKVQWFTDCLSIALAQNCLFYLPFWEGVDDGAGDGITWLTKDSATIAEIIKCVNACAPAIGVPIGGDPPAVNGGATSFTGNSVTVQAAGGTSATSATGATTTAISSNTVHHTGGAGASGSTGAGGSPGVPYTVCVSTSTGSSSHAITVATGSTAGDAIVVSASSNSGNINSCADSKGNKYVLGQSQSGVALAVSIFVATTAADGVSPTVALTTSDTITVTFANSAAAQCVIARGCSGVSLVNPVDVNIGAAATSTAPSSGSTGTLSQASEWAVAALADSNGGGSPTSWTGGFTARSTQHTGVTEWLTVADQTVSATTALTAGATIVSAQWCMALVTLQFVATGASFGGGGGSSAGQTAVGTAGALSVGGVAPDIGGDGGSGSTAPGTLPLPGMAPGGGGGGAASTGTAIQGGSGGNGQVIISRVTSQEAFSTLVVHVPSPDAPANLSPLVTFGASPVAANGGTEYTVPALVSGVNAGFQGTYTVVAVAGTTVANPWSQPAVPRTLTVSIRQYEYTGGPHATAQVARTFTPVTDDPSQNGILPIGEVTLPIKDVDPGNTSAFYTITIDETSSGLTQPNDLFLDVMFLDTQGQTVIISDAVDNAYQTYYLDAPASNRDLGRIMGSNVDRTQAVSVMDQCVAISGGPLALYPGDNVILAYACEGAPQLGITYFPAWYLERTS